MNLVELDRALRHLRLSGMADVLEARLRHAQTERLAPLDVLSALVGDELVRRQDRLLARRHKQARFRDPDRSLDSFDFAFNKKMNRALIHELATGRFIAQHEDALFLGPPGTGTSYLAQALGRAAIHQGHKVLYYPPGPRRQRGRGFYGRAVVRRVCGHVARRLAYQRGQVCQERLAIEFPAVPAALPAPECHAPRAAFRRAATITARAGHRTRPVVVTPDAPPARPPL